MNKKKYKHLLWGIGVVSLAIILTLLIVSQTYIRNLVYHERLSQMEEVTHQMFRSLDDVIDTHWSDVDVQCNYLYNTPLETDTDLYRYLNKLSELSNYPEKQTELVAVDASGRYYTEHGSMGLQADSHRFRIIYRLQAQIELAGDFFHFVTRKIQVHNLGTILG